MGLPRLSRLRAALPAMTRPYIFPSFGQIDECLRLQTEKNSIAQLWLRICKLVHTQRQAGSQVHTEPG